MRTAILCLLSLLFVGRDPLMTRTMNESNLMILSTIGAAGNLPQVIQDIKFLIRLNRTIPPIPKNSATRNALIDAAERLPNSAARNALIDTAERLPIHFYKSWDQPQNGVPILDLTHLLRLDEPMEMSDLTRRLEFRGKSGQQFKLEVKKQLSASKSDRFYFSIHKTLFDLALIAASTTSLFTVVADACQESGKKCELRVTER